MLQFAINYTFKDITDYRIEVYTGSWDQLDLTKATQSYGIILNDQNQIVISYNSETGNWLLPGGTIEVGESSIQALVREVYEEAAVVVDESTIIPAFYQQVFELEDDEEKNNVLQLRYIARAQRIDQFVSDPGGAMTEVKWVTLDELSNYLDWGQTVPLIVSIARGYGANK
jgi:8-oxo-dGTP pyrophosphatase MutT (NUDIX family)